ncbi:MAG: hypothetical protein P8X55_08465 [Desulfosarcinaceae bacterium]
MVRATDRADLSIPDARDPFSGMAHHCKRSFESAASFFSLASGMVCLENHIPVMGNAYNKTTGQTEEVQAGTLRVKDNTEAVSRLAGQLRDLVARFKL